MAARPRFGWEVSLSLLPLQDWMGHFPLTIFLANPPYPSSPSPISFLPLSSILEEAKWDTGHQTPPLNSHSPPQWGGAIGFAIGSLAR